LGAALKISTRRFILAIFELPDRKTEAVRIARRAMMAGVCVSGAPIRIPAAHAACSGAHTGPVKCRPSGAQTLFAVSDWSCAGQNRREIEQRVRIAQMKPKAWIA